MVSGIYTTWTTCSRHNTNQVIGTSILLIRIVSAGRTFWLLVPCMRKVHTLSLHNHLFRTLHPTLNFHPIEMLLNFCRRWNVPYHTQEKPLKLFQSPISNSSRNIRSGSEGDVRFHDKNDLSRHATPLTTVC